MRITFDHKAGPHERFAPDVKLPAPGSPIRIREGGEATLVAAEYVDSETLRVSLEVPESYRDLVSIPLSSFSLGGEA